MSTRSAATIVIEGRAIRFRLTTPTGDRQRRYLVYLLSPGWETYIGTVIRWSSLGIWRIQRPDKPVEAQEYQSRMYAAANLLKAHLS